MRACDVLKANAATAWRESTLATSAAMLSAAHAEEAVAPNARAAGLVVSAEDLCNRIYRDTK